MWTTTCKRMKLEHVLTQYTKISSKWIKNLNVRPDTMKLLEKNMGRTLFDINHSNIFFNPPLNENRSKNKQISLNKQIINLKSFCIAKETINEMKRQPTK